jgi:serine/threonine protein kinase
MSFIGDAAIARLRAIDDRPDFSSTRYELLDAIGRGGMGIVFRGRDRELDREVAIKVTAWYTAADAERLRAEARVLARLEHPGIVPVHDVGRLPDGRVFTVMMLVRGERLDVCAAGVPLRDRLRLFDRVCDTVAFAHARGLVHRDLKPANIMVGQHGEVLVLDWGLACPERAERVEGACPERAERVEAACPERAERVEAACPERAERVEGARGERDAGGPGGGTEGYMPPEQHTAAVDARADVYALGVILRDLAAAPAMPRPLASIVTRATAEDPGDRYEGPAALAADVRRFMDGAAVAAHRESPLEWTTRQLRVYRTPLGLIAAYLAMRGLLVFWSR